MVTIDKCRVCGSTKIKKFFDLGEQPFANALLKNLFQEEKKYSLSLSWCPECNLVQLNETADPEELFSNYVWVTSTSSTARDYAENFCDMVLENQFIDKNNSYVLEIASNDGTFLKPFIKKGYNVLGVDPAKNIVSKCNEEGIECRCDFFNQKVAKDILSDKGYPTVVFARNVLPHVANLHDFVGGIEELMIEDNLLVLEIHYTKIILEELHYDSIYHEHLCYFTLKSLSELLYMYGLHMYDVNYSPISGGSLVVFISKNKRLKSQRLIELEQLEEKEKTNELSSWNIFAKTSEKHRCDFVDIINKKLKENKIIAGYGASARSSTLLNYCGITNKHICCIADKNSMKQRLFTPGSHIPILNIEEMLQKNPEVIIILAWNFKDEIIQDLKYNYGYKGEFIIPLPNTPKLI